MGIGGQQLKYETFFTPNLFKTYSFIAIPTYSGSMDLEVVARMHNPEDYDLSKYVKLRPTILKNVKSTENPGFTAYLKLPSSIPSPGSHRLDICVGESVSSGGMVGSRSEACAFVVIKVVYDEKTMVANLNVHNTNIGKPIFSEVTITNWGKPKLEKIYAELMLYDMDNNSLSDLIKTSSISLDSTKTGKLSAIFDSLNLNAGKYQVKGKLYADKLIKNISDTFEIGTLDVKLNSYPKKLSSNKISKVNIEVSSRWGNPIKNVYAEYYIGNYKMVTPSITLNPWKTENLSAFFDASKINPGKYDGKIILVYENHKKTKKFEAELVNDIIKEKPSFHFNYKIGLSILLFFLIIINFIIILIIIKKRHSNEKK